MGVIIFLALIAAGPIISVFFNKRQEENNRRLIEFIIQNYGDLASGCTLDYNGTPISANSRLTRFRYCYSFIIMTSSRSSGLYLTDGLYSDEARHAKMICQLITVLSGWWGVPWGIINSIRFLFQNGIKNGTNDESVGNLMTRLG